MILLYMGAFLNNKDFEKFYWPTFQKVIHIAAENGQGHADIPGRRLDAFPRLSQDLPQGTQLWAEYGDPKNSRINWVKRWSWAVLSHDTAWQRNKRRVCGQSERIA